MLQLLIFTFGILVPAAASTLGWNLVLAGEFLGRRLPGGAGSVRAAHWMMFGGLGVAFVTVACLAMSELVRSPLWPVIMR